MTILYDAPSRTFRLDAKNTSYAFCVDEHGYLLHLYFGGRISDRDVTYLKFNMGVSSFSPNPPGSADGDFSLDTARQEYPCNGAGDYRTSALMIRGSNGCASTDLRYRSHEIRNGKYALEGLPAVYADDAQAQTLEVILADPLTGAEVHLLYGVLEEYDVITRACVVRNGGNAPFVIEKAASCAVDFPTMDYDLLHLYGKWAQERWISRTPLSHELHTIASKRGASSHQHNPFAALLGRTADEEHGEAYGFSLVYSGNFAIEAECDAFDSTRVVMGINPVDFAWTLSPGECFTTPEAVLVRSGEGLGGMSRTLHRLFRRQLCRGEWKDRKRPVVINNWEATYFDFDEKKLLAIAEDAACLGIDMLVMDDGWFGRRNRDDSSLGDWYVNREKLPGGLGQLADSVNALGMQLGIWFEPEMISPDSMLYREHPDWCLCAPGRQNSIARHQFVLDMSRRDVRDGLFDALSRTLQSANIAYVKWDFNRNLTEAGSALLPAERQQEVFHRYVLGLYELLERLTSAFPHILFEGCSGGGGRFDPGMLYYSPQIWTSDDTDALERCRIQYGTSIAYPLSSISAHVSAVPNHQTGRSVGLNTRGRVAATGAFGYELDLTKLTDEERDTVRGQIAEYHAYEHIVREGDFYRLRSPFDDPQCCAWESVSEDRKEALVTFVVTRGRPHMTVRLRLMGLDPAKRYRESATGRILCGDTLMNAGLNLNGSYGDGESRRFYFQAVE